MVTVVQTDREHPIRLSGGCWLHQSGEIDEIRRAVAVKHLAQIGLGVAYWWRPVGLVRRGQAEPGAVLMAVDVEDRVAPVIEGPADTPFEDAAGIRGIGDTAVRAITEYRDDVVAGDRAPVHHAGLGRPPALDAGEQPLDAWAVIGDLVIHAEDFAGHYPPRALGVENRHQILCAGKDVDVGFADIVVLRQSPVGFAPYRRGAQTPAETERTIARAGVVGERQLRRHPRRAEGQRHGQIGGAGRRCYRELLAEPPDRTTGFRQRHLGQLGDESILRNPCGEVVARLFRLGIGTQRASYRVWGRAGEGGL